MMNKPVRLEKKQSFTEYYNFELKILFFIFLSILLIWFAFMVCPATGGVTWY